MVSIYVILLKACTYILHIFFCSKIKHTFFECFCCLQGTVITMDFSVFLHVRRHKNWVHKISSWKYLSKDLFSQFFPEHRMPHFCSLPWTPFRECWKSAAVSVLDLIVIAAAAAVKSLQSCPTLYHPIDGSPPGIWQMPICSWHAQSSFLLL